MDITGAGSFKHLIEKHNDLKEYLDNENIDPIKGAAFFAGLLTCPEMQSNTLRLEALIHIVLSSCVGTRKLNAKSVNKLFLLLKDSYYGYGEDPAEDVFVSNIISSKGNYRIFEGIWESNAFTLQRFIDILEHTPDSDVFNNINNNVFSLLMLSEEIAKRANIKRYSIGTDNPCQIIPEQLLENHNLYTSYIRFTFDELKNIGIDLKNLSPFILSSESFHQILDENLGESILEAKPIVFYNNNYYVLLPTAVGVAIKKYMISELDNYGYLNSFEDFLWRAYADYYRSIPVLGDLFNIPLFFKKDNYHYNAECSIEIDTGRYIHFIFILDNFIDYKKGWINSFSPHSDKVGLSIQKSITNAKNQFKAREGFKDGISLIVVCGWGRIISIGFEHKNEENWKVRRISDYDIAILSLMSQFRPETLFRLLEAEDTIKTMNSFIMNVNGILNLYSWALSNNHHLIPHESLSDTEGIPHHVMIDLNSLLYSRHEVLNQYDDHVVNDIDGKLIHVRRKNIDNYFKEDDELPIYISLKDLNNKVLLSLIESKNIHIWCSISVFDDSDRSLEYKIWDAMNKWISLILPLINTKDDDLKIFKWNMVFRSLALPDNRININEDELSIKVNVSVENGCTINTIFEEDFIYGFFSKTNICEKTILRSFLQGMQLLLDDSFFEIDDILNAVMLSEYAKNIHLFTAREYRDFFKDQLSKPIYIDKFDDSTSRFGLGWLVRKPEEGNTIEGFDNCIKYLNMLMDEVIKKTNAFYHKFNRYDLVSKLLINHESIQSESDHWNNTAKSILSIQNDIQNCYDVISDQQFKFKGSAMSTRLAIEIALCECPLNGGQAAGILDISKIITYSSCLHHLGGWSDAIRYGLLEPVVKISPYGQIMMYYNSLEEVVQPYGKALEHDSIDRASENYPELFKDQEFVTSVDAKFENEFLSAWVSEFGFSFDVGRRIIDCLEDKGLEFKKPVYNIKYIELIEFLKNSTGFDVKIIKNFIETLTLVTRDSWTIKPQGYRSKDIWLWKFKRKLSVISKPIIQIEILDNPMLLITPALIRDGFIYILRGCYSYLFEEDNFQSQQMRTWIGSRRNEIGHNFNKEVAEELKKLGWNAKSDVKLTELLNTKLDKDYGDIDVFAWDDKTNRILLIECKTLNLAKTYGEIAEQLYEFNGQCDAKGKPDRLMKHLIRKDVCMNNRERIYKYTKMTSSPEIEIHLVFSNIVPMVFSKNKKLNNIKITIFNNLSLI